MHLQIHYRPDNYPDWVHWRTFTGRFDLIGTPGALDIGGLPSARPGFAPRVPFGKPSDECDPTTMRKLRRGYQFQVRFKGSGHVIIDRFRLHAQRLIEKATAQC
jgi:hypothetical protein